MSRVVLFRGVTEVPSPLRPRRLPERYGASSSPVKPLGLSRFQKKIGRLEKERPAAAALLEQLVDDALNGPRRLPIFGVDEKGGA